MESALEVFTSQYYQLSYAVYVRITIYSVPGPNSWGIIPLTSFTGGWKYSFASIQSLSQFNQEIEFEVILGHLNSFGPVPRFPEIPRVIFTVLELDLKNLDMIHPTHQSSQHGALLNHIIWNRPPTTDYYIVIDPDFFVLGDNAIENLILEMSSQSIDIWGVSYPCEWPLPYYWDFPVAYFQIFRASSVPSSILDFRPDESQYVPDKSQRSGYGLPRPKYLKMFNYVFYNLNRAILKIGLLGLSNVLMIFRDLAINRFLYRKFDLFRDTGWKNRFLLSDLAVMVFPQFVRLVNYPIPFWKSDYLERNSDVAKSSLNPLWHYLNFGIYEKRPVGSRNFFYGLISQFIASTDVMVKAHPVSSIKGFPSFFGLWSDFSDSKVLRHGFFYDLGSGNVGVHLGHAAKDENGYDLKVVDFISENIKKKEG